MKTIYGEGYNKGEPKVWIVDKFFKACKEVRNAGGVSFVEGDRLIVGMVDLKKKMDQMGVNVTKNEIMSSLVESGVRFTYPIRKTKQRKVCISVDIQE
jgi:hypothetical protein